jgi:hypothetical protein
MTMGMFDDDPTSAALHRFYDVDPRRLDELAAALHQAAVAGDMSALKLIVERIDGDEPPTDPSRL